MSKKQKPERATVTFNVPRLFADGMGEFLQVDWDAVVAGALCHTLNSMHFGVPNGVPMVDGETYNPATRERIGK